MRRLLLILFCLACVSGWAQDPVIQLKPEIKDDISGRAMAGVTIEILADGKPFATKNSASNGQIPTIDLPIGPVYTVKIKKQGYVTKMMTINSHSDFPDELPIFYEQPFETTMFQTVEGIDFSFLEREPMIEFSFDSQSLLSWDATKLKVMQKKIEDLKRQLAEKKAQQELEQKANAAAEKNYSAYLAAGDAAMLVKDYAKAVTQYQAAIAVKADPIVQTKLDEAKKLLAEQQGAADLQKKFGEKMAAAKIAYDAKQWDQALALYKEAVVIKSDEQLPKDRIIEIQKIVDNPVFLRP